MPNDPVVESPFTGLTACVKIGSGSSAVVLAYISGVDLTLEKEIIEILQFGATFKEKVPAIKDWSISIDGTVALATGGTQKQLYDAFNDASALTLGIFLDANTYFEGTGYVQSFNISAAPDDKISLTAEIAGSGAVTLTLPGTTYSVTYDANTGTGTMTDASSPYAAGATVTVKSNSFTPPSGKTFVKWNTAANGSGTDYSPAATFTINANTTLYAQWST